MDITVAGTSRTSEAPQLGTVHLQCELQGDALDRVVERTTSLVSRLQAALSAAKDDTVVRYVVPPLATRTWRPWNDQGDQLAPRYAATCIMQATFSGREALSRFVTEWGSTDGVSVQSVEWSLTDERRAQVQEHVLRDAVAEARRRAQIIATAAGAEKIEMIEIADPGLLTAQSAPGNGGLQPEPVAMARFGNAESAPVVPADVEFSATVHARFTTL